MLNDTRAKKKLVIFAVVIIALVLVFSFFVTQQYLNQLQITKPNNNIEPQTSTSTNTTELTPTLRPTETSIPIPTQTNTSITRDDAINIAAPIILQYAEENNRTIANVTAYTQNELNTDNIYHPSFSSNGTVYCVIAGFVKYRTMLPHLSVLNHGLLDTKL